jgi:hypothetical protein
MTVMSNLNAIEEAVKALAPHDLAAFRHWFADFDSASWHLQIERDLADGKLNNLMADAIADDRV